MPNFDTITRGALSSAIHDVLADAAAQLTPGEGLHVDSLIQLLRMGAPGESEPGGKMHVQLLGEIAELAKDGVIHLEASYDREDGRPGWDVFWGPKPAPPAVARGEVEGTSGAAVPDAKALAKAVKKLRRRVKQLERRVDGIDEDFLLAVAKPGVPVGIGGWAVPTSAKVPSEGRLLTQTPQRDEDQRNVDEWLRHASLKGLNLDTFDEFQLNIIADRMGMPSEGRSEEHAILSHEIWKAWARSQREHIRSQEDGSTVLFPDGVVVDRGIREGIFR